MTRAPPKSQEKKSKKLLTIPQTSDIINNVRGKPQQNSERGALFMEKKFTKKDYFTAIICLAEGEGFPEDITADMVADFCKAQIALLDKRSTASRKPTKSQVENEGYKAKILEHMAGADSPLTVKAIWEGVPELSKLTNQRVTHLLMALTADGLVEQFKDKKKPSLYSLK